MKYVNLTLAFFHPEDDDHWINRLVARVSRYPYCHVELYFETVNECFSIQRGETAHMRVKNLSSPCYEIVTLNVTEDEYNKCLHFCRAVSSENIDFDKSGMYWSYFNIMCCGVNSRLKHKTFCSKIVCEAMQAGGIEEVLYYQASNMTPSRLYQRVKNSKRRVCASVPYKCMQLVNKKQIVCFQNKMYYRLYNEN